MRCTSARIKLKMIRTDGRFLTMSVNSVPELVSEIAVAKLTGKMLWWISSTWGIRLPTVMVKPQMLVEADYQRIISRFEEIRSGNDKKEGATKVPRRSGATQLKQPEFDSDIFWPEDQGRLGLMT
ncbi:unnamed protein product [Toxocara canis]|uniref:Uncharacterized protein n=1 Tax=Toxocara canis TaxID=6265 RepID=A0A183TV36_TOXCA|nr:unnamed protein product [Toxocara canis]